MADRLYTSSEADEVLSALRFETKLEKATLARIAFALSLVKDGAGVAPSPSFSGGEMKRPTFIGEDELHGRMRAGRVAIDLGAAPGGWSQVLAARGLRVLAVDNGPIAKAVLDTQLVEHRREDAFRFRPERPVDWMVCDVVAAPARIAALVAQWIARGWCRETIFNLKLPNKDRWQEVLRCHEVIERALAKAEGRHALRIKHLYHDREEVTGHLQRL